MNVRSGLVIVVLVLIGVFSALNWSVLMAPTDLSLGFTTAKAPLGLIMLGLIVLLAAVFLIYIVVLQAGMMSESRRVSKELKAQRELADKAEASRFTELRAFVQSQQAQSQEAFMVRLDALEAHLIARAQESDNSAAAYIGQLEQQIGRTSGQG